MDALGDVMLSMRLLASTVNILDLGTPWGILGPEQESHLALCMTLLDGPCWFEGDGFPLFRMKPGDSIIVRAGAKHRTVSTPQATATSFAEFIDAQGSRRLSIDNSHSAPLISRLGNSTIRTRLLVYALIAQDAGPSSVLANLGPIIHIQDKEGHLAPFVAAAVAFLSSESKDRPGYVATASRLVELLFTQMLREHILADHAIGASWMRGLRDPRIGRAVTCIHQEADKAWTVAQLARQAGMGRSSFARRFVELLGVSPIDYLIGHRMELAAIRLAVDRARIAQVAEELGLSERAFRTAFRSRFGIPPSQYARQLGGASPRHRTG